MEEKLLSGERAEKLVGQILEIFENDSLDTTHFTIIDRFELVAGVTEIWIGLDCDTSLSVSVVVLTSERLQLIDANLNGIPNIVRYLKAPANGQPSEIIGEQKIQDLFPETQAEYTLLFQNALKGFLIARKLGHAIPSL